VMLTGGFVAPDTLVLTAVDSRRHFLSRIIASTGAVVDSVPLPVSRFVLGGAPSPDGTRLLIQSIDKLSFGLGDSMTVSVIDRSGHTTDSLRVLALSTAVWAGTLDAVVLASPTRVDPNGVPAGMVFVRRRLDGRGRFVAGADTLKVLTEGWGPLLGVSADGTQLFYQMTRPGETTLWTAIRADARGAFARGRRIGSSTGSLLGTVSRGGGWIRFRDVTTGPSGAHTRLEVEPFAGGERHVLEPALVGVRNTASAFRDDGLIVATDAGAGRTTLTTYPLPSGAPILRRTFNFLIDDLEELSDGRLVTVTENGRVIRVIGRQNDLKDFPVPDSLGPVMGVAPSPSGPEFAIATVAFRDDRLALSILRLNPDVGRYTLVTRTSGFTNTIIGLPQWTTDGWLHMPLAGPGDQQVRLYRGPVTGGAFAAEPPIGFESNASMGLVSRDGRRTVVRVQSQSTDLWVLRAASAR